MYFVCKLLKNCQKQVDNMFSYYFTLSAHYSYIQAIAPSAGAVIPAKPTNVPICWKI